MSTAESDSRSSNFFSVTDVELKPVSLHKTPLELPLKKISPKSVQKAAESDHAAGRILR